MAPPPSAQFVAAVFLLVTDEEGAFWLLVALCRRVIPDYHTHMMTGLRIDTQLFSSMVAQCLPNLDAHFSELQVQRRPARPAQLAACRALR